MMTATERIPELQAEVDTLLEECLAFARAHGAPCFLRWPDSILREYLLFHAEHGSLILSREGGRERGEGRGTLTGLLVAWQCRRDDLETHWLVTDPAGDCLYFAQAIAPTPAGLAALCAAAKERWPGWERLQCFSRRTGRLTRYTTRALQHLHRKASR